MNKTIDEIFELYEKYGKADYIGESLTQTEHMIQTAMLAEEYTQYRKDRISIEIVLAALFHDIGHLLGLKYAKEGKSVTLMGRKGVQGHETLGALYLKERGFSERIVNLVENHVQAKRYLTAKDPTYFEKLSVASKKTLKYQGGPMSTEEATIFEQHPQFELILRLREWDDYAKENIPIRSLEYYKQMVLNYYQI